MERWYIFIKVERCYIFIARLARYECMNAIYPSFSRSFDSIFLICVDGLDDKRGG